jgi:predicted phage-related endonuclease
MKPDYKAELLDQKGQQIRVSAESQETAKFGEMAYLALNSAGPSVDIEKAIKMVRLSGKVHKEEEISIDEAKILKDAIKGSKVINATTIVAMLDVLGEQD